MDNPSSEKFPVMPGSQEKVTSIVHREAWYEA